jgi:hypothetical protein
MSNLTILSDAELDAVSGGGQIANGGGGGAGGSAINGASVSISGGRHNDNDVDLGRADLSVSRSSARGGNGGDGGRAVIVNR